MSGGSGLYVLEGNAGTAAGTDRAVLLGPLPEGVTAQMRERNIAAVRAVAKGTLPGLVEGPPGRSAGEAIAYVAARQCARHARERRDEDPPVTIREDRIELLQACGLLPYEAAKRTMWTAKPVKKSTAAGGAA